ncbi:MAG: hypothetical protein U9R08_02630 [Nanoarchaeota archaeon]|nr:hypothetical protein [Nanoarchaeota archaeon]
MKYDLFEDIEKIKGLTEIEALFQLEKPSIFKVKGKDSSKAVLISSLIHGNEPSGFRAILKEINSEQQYPIDVYFFIGNVASAKIEPYFSNRLIPGKQNFNRTWVNNPQTELELTSRELLDFFKTLPLIAVLDLHSFTAQNTPPHCMTVDSKSSEIAQKFVPYIFELDIPLGAMIEQTKDIPSFVIECGTNNTQDADEFALKTLQRFFIEFKIKNGDNQNISKGIFSHATNIKIKQDVKIKFSDKKEDADLTVRKDCQSLNITEVASHTIYGWGNSLDVFEMKDKNGTVSPDTYFFIEDGKILFKKDIVPNFMATNQKIAKESGFYFFEKK